MEKKGMREGMDPRPGDKKKGTRLTSHSTAMDFVIQFSGNGMVPRQCLGQISYLLEGAPSEQGAHTVFPQGKMPQRLQKVKWDREGHGVQHQRLQRVHHVEQLD